MMTELADRYSASMKRDAPEKGRAKAEARMPGRRGHAGDALMRLPWRHESRQIEPKLAVSGKAMELQTAKEIFAEVLHARRRRGGRR